MVSDRPGFLDELKRRKVVRTVLVYLAAAFAAIEAADIVFPVLGLPEWAFDLLLGLAGGVPAYTIARAYMQLDERASALDWLERAYESGDPLLPFAFASVIFVPLRNEARFQALASSLIARSGI